MIYRGLLNFTCRYAESKMKVSEHEAKLRSLDATTLSTNNC